MTDLIHTTVAEGVFEIEIHRPEKKNALTAEMYAAMADALDAAETDASVRVILIHGSEGNFTAGNDLNDFLRNPPAGENSPVFRFINGFANLKKPFVAAVEGVAIGIGTTMLLHCDLVYAGTGARFCMPFTNLGLTPEAGSSLLLAQRIGHVRAAEMLMLGEQFDAEYLLGAGLVNAVIPHGQVVEHALSRCQKLAAQPAAAIRLTKELMVRNQRSLVNKVMANESQIFGEQLGSPEAKEAFSAFLEKRRPDFSKFS